MKSLSSTLTSKAKGHSTFNFLCLTLMPHSWLRPTHCTKLKLRQIFSPKSLYSHPNEEQKGRSITAFIQDPITEEILYSHFVLIPWNANSELFCTAIKEFSNFGSFQATCTSTMFDNKRSIVVSETSAVTYKWTLSLNLLRPDSLIAWKLVPFKLEDYDGTFTY